MSNQKCFLQPYSLQIAGSTPLLTFQNEKIAKPVCSNEFRFYDSIIEKFRPLMEFVPDYSGKVALDFASFEEVSKEAFEVESKDDIIPEECPISKQRKGTIDSIESVSIRSTPETNMWSYGKLVRKMSERKCKIMRENSLSGCEEDDLVYVLIEDVTNKINEPCILDLKVGTQQHSPKEPERKIFSKQEKCRKSTSSSLGLRLSGMRTYENGQVNLKDKYFGRSLSANGLKDTIRHFVSKPSDSGSHIRRAIVEELVSQLDRLIAAVKKTKIRFYGCSLLIAYPSTENEDDNSRPKLKVIDFANADIDGYYDTYDDGFVFGLVNLKKILADILD